MKNSIFILLFLFSIYGSAQSNKISIYPVDSLVINADTYIGNDAYDYHYFIKNNVFFKKNNQEIWQYKNVSFGKIAKVDIHNPLKIILYYENFNTVVALDNQLNEVEKINFSAITPQLMVSAIGLSGNNNFWVFNDLNQQLGLYNFVNNTYVIRGLPFTKSIKNYHSDFNFFYWIDADNRFYSCDVFGKTAFLVTVPDYDSVSITNEKNLLFSKNDQLFYLDVALNKILLIKNIEKSMKSYSLTDQKLVIFTTNGIIKYQINLP